MGVLSLLATVVKFSRFPKLDFALDAGRLAARELARECILPDTRSRNTCEYAPRGRRNSVYVTLKGISVPIYGAL